MKFGVVFLVIFAVLNVYVVGSTAETTPTQPTKATASPKLSKTTTLTQLSTAPKLFVCPNSSEIPKECKCYEVSERIICTAIKAKFALTKNYTLQTLTIINSPDLSDLADNTIPSEHTLKVEALIIIQTDKSTEKIPSMQILQNVLSISTDSIKITGNKEAVTDSLDVEELSSSIKSLVIEGIPKLTNFELTKFTNLEILKIIKTNLDEKFSQSLFFTLSPIKYLEFIKTNISGSFSFNPKLCTKNDQIVIKLHDNIGLTAFDFTTLLQGTLTDQNNCSYHIELKNNKLNENLFSNNKQTETVKKFYEKENKNLFLTIKNPNPFVCPCALFKTYNLNKPYIHGINCKIQKDDSKSNVEVIKLLASITSDLYKAEKC